MDANETGSTPPMKWYEIWWHVWTHPGAEAFRTILRDPKARANRGFVWIAVTAIIAALASFFLSYNMAYSPLEEIGPWKGMTVFFFICTAILTPIVAIIGFAITAAIYRAVASLFRGTGTWEKMVYALAAVTAPSTILSIPSFFLSGFLTKIDTGNLVELIPVGLLGLFYFALGIYVVVLLVSAIDGVENFGTWKAVATYFIPVIVGFILVLCLFLTILFPFFRELGT